VARLIKRIFLFGLFVVIIVPGLIWLGRIVLPTAHNGRAPWSGLILVRFGEADRYGCWQDIFADLAMRIAERSSAVNGESKP
jgi:hypothetical protein